MGVGWLGRSGLCVLVGCGDSSGSDSGADAEGSATSADSTTGATSSASSAEDDGTGSTSGRVTSDSGESGGESTTGITPGTDCESVADCVLDDDCCHCDAMPELPPGHGCAEPTCDQTVCEEYGIAQPECVAGHCVLPKVDCDASTVDCAAAPPECLGLQVPAVAMGCWTGECVPVSLCNGAVYFNCDECGPDESCVNWAECAGDSCTLASTCQPPPEGCANAPACACGGDAVCAAWGFDCYDNPDDFFCCKGDAEACGFA
jgi:hypothetical protein